MLTYKEMDNLAAVEIELADRVSTEEFDKTAKKLDLDHLRLAKLLLKADEVIA